MKWEEVLLISALAALLIAPWFAFGLKLWGIFFSCVVLLLAIFEGIAKLTTDRTLSQQFWAFSKKDKVKAVVVLVCMLAAWGLLLTHLAAKLL